MANTRWEVWTIARWFSDKDLVFETIKGKHLYHTGSGNNNERKRSKWQESPFLYDEPAPSDLKLQEMLFFVIKISYYF